MRYLVTGANGALGSDLVKELEKRRQEVLGTTRETMNIVNRRKVDEVVESFKPDVIIHSAAYTKVNKAETDRTNAVLTNGYGTKNVVDAAELVKAKVIYISSDYVFDGTKDINEEYEVDDKTNPLSVYGKSKYLGELYTKEYDKSFIVRTSWVFGEKNPNFVKTMLKLGEKHKEVNVVDDQIGSPTYTVDLAKLLVDISTSNKYGTYHATNLGYISWATFAEEIFKTFDMDVKVNHVTTKEYEEMTKTKGAPRPHNSKLSHKSLFDNGFNFLPTYNDALNRYKEDLKAKKLILK